MSVRKRTWTTTTGEQKEAWIVDYTDQNGQRHIKTFDRKKDADAHAATVKVDVSSGVHTPENRSVTVAEAADNWIRYVELEGRERSTVAQYRQHVDQHIAPRIGREKLAKLTAPRINVFRDDLLKELSRPLARKVLTSLKAILKDAKRRGNVAQNVAADVSIAADRRGNGKLKIGVDIPTPVEIRTIVHAAQGRWRPFLIVAAFTGLRASELRGLRWADIDLKRGELHVHQRADRWGTIGDPKSETSERTIPIGPFVVNTLKEWKLAGPKGKLDLVFGNGTGNVENHGNIIQRGFWPTQIAAGVVDHEGKPKYSGLHALRHFYASWCINRRADGGLELPIKLVQQRLGHASIVMTSDVYGHLFPSRDDGAELAAAEQALFATH
jgi:integrase